MVLTTLLGLVVMGSVPHREQTGPGPFLMPHVVDYQVAFQGAPNPGQSALLFVYSYRRQRPRLGPSLTPEYADVDFTVPARWGREAQILNFFVLVYISGQCTLKLITLTLWCLRRAISAPPKKKKPVDNHSLTTGPPDRHSHMVTICAMYTLDC